MLQSSREESECLDAAAINFDGLLMKIDDALKIGSLEKRNGEFVQEVSFSYLFAVGRKLVAESQRVEVVAIELLDFSSSSQ